MTVNLARESAFTLGIGRNRGSMVTIGIAMILNGGAGQMGTWSDAKP